MSNGTFFSDIAATVREILEKRSGIYIVIFLAVSVVVAGVVIKMANKPTNIIIGVILGIILIAIAFAVFVYGREKEDSGQKNSSILKWFSAVIFLLAIVVFVILFFLSSKNTVIPEPNISETRNKKNVGSFIIAYTPPSTRAGLGPPTIKFGSIELHAGNNEIPLGESENFKLEVDYSSLFNRIDALNTELATLKERNQLVAKRQAKLIELAVLGPSRKNLRVSGSGREDAGIVFQVGKDAANIEEEINKAMGFSEINEIEKAIETLSSVIDEGKENACDVALAENAKGWIYFSKGIFKSAETEYNFAEDNAESCLENRSIEKAELNEFKLKLYNNMGLNYYFMRMRNRAERYFSRAREVNSESAIAARYLDLIRYDNAADLISDGIEFRNEDMFRNAVIKYQEALEEDPSNLDALSYRGYAYYRLAANSKQVEEKKDLLKDAKKDVEYVLRHDPARWDAIINLIKIVSEAEGLSAAKETIDNNRDDVELVYYTIISDCELKKWYPEIMSYIKTTIKPIGSLNGGSSDVEALSSCSSDQQQENR